jgi:chemotaxis protein MotB
LGRRRKKVEQQGGAPAWMTTYGDMVTLLLCFFVLLYSFSSIDSQKFKLLQISLRDALGVLTGGRTLDSGTLINGGEVYEGISRYQEEEIFREIKENVENALGREDMQETVYFSTNERGLIIRFLDNALFDTGKADLKPEAKETLNKVADILGDYPDRSIRVEGHTDNIPINTAMFPSNWELSTARATTVIRHLLNRYHFSPDKLSAAGYGEYKPVGDNAKPEGRKLNRRVDIVVLRTSTVQQEPE